MLGTITLTVGQPDAVSQKEEATENTVSTQEEVAPQVNGEKVEKESPDANDISAVEETAGEEKPDDATEVGFKKIFRFVGFKFTLKKDKSEEKDPVKLLNVKDKDEEKVSDEPTKEEEEAVAAEEKSTAEEKEADTEAPTLEAGVAEDTTDKAETTDAPAEESAAENTDEAVKEEGAEKEAETSQETTLTMSPLKKLFSTGLFSNLRKKTSIKKTRDEEDKEAAAEEKTEETAAEVEEKEVTVEAEQQIKEDASVTPEEEKSEATPESETPALTAAITDESKQEEEKVEASTEEEKAPAEVTSEAELLSSQEKAKPQGSPLKKLFTGAGLKKLSTKKQKTKKDTESKLTESGEQAAEQLQSSTDSAEAPKAESGPSSPEESGEHVIAVEVTQNESSQEADAEVTSDGEKKKEGIIAWSSFKRLVTPKKLVKRSSDSEDEATGEKPAKSATLSSSESAALTDNSVEEEAKEEKPTEEEPKTENTEKLVSSTEEPKKKMDTSVSWEALMCMGGTKKRTRRTSDSDDEETKVEEEAAAVETAVEEEQEAKTEADAANSQNTESEAEVVSSPEPVSSPPERESTWDTLKRMVMPKNKAKVEEKPEDNGNQVQSDSEAPKDESSFSLRKFFPGLRKRKVEKQDSTEQGEEDSDTPAVVPLSEYDEQVEATQEAPAESALVESTGSSEDRAPSWISATIEDAENQHDQLSDIPEEAENAATPKSADTDLADDEIQDDATTSPRALGGRGRRLSTAEVASVAPAPDAEATLVPPKSITQCATEVMEAAEVHVSEISPQTSVAVEDVLLNVASEKNEFEPQTETSETKTNTILQVHARDEAMAICTGLGTKTIAKVALEKPAVPLIEDMAVVRDALSTEVLVEEIPAGQEQATATEDLLLKAQVQEVATTDLEPCVNSVVESVDIKTAAESQEPEIENIGVITTTLEESLVLQSTTVTENSPKAEIINPITPTSETAVCTQSVEVSEPKVETKELKMDMEQLVAATEENAPIKEVVQVVTEELAVTVCEKAKASITEETEPEIPVVLPSEEVPIITQTVILTSLSPESDQVAEIKEEAKVVDTVKVTTVQVLETEISAVSEQVTSDIEAQGVVIMDAVDKISDMPEPEKPATPTFTIPEPVQAVAKIEEEIVVLTESPLITDTPVTALCEQPAPKSPRPLHVATQVVDTLAIEVTESLDSLQQEEDKKAIDIKVNEEIVVLEEVMECQTGEELDEVEKEQRKEEAENQEPDVEQAAKEVKTQVEETKPEAPSKNKESEIHVPAQVVLQIAQVVEEASVEEEAIEEFDSNGPVDKNTSVKAEASANKLATLTEEASEVPSQVTEAAAAAAAASQPDTEKTSSEKCAEVMAQVIEVIEEAVKEIEPVSTEIIAAS
ncbi:A-kinase anchor protein 12 isoform X2 [Solea senegalensis]|uniref:A-kinase anchor protein 12 isoform X2 n=1 Tax=Solea senegalensis TaxID=28829 RepID=A0AAV6RWI7_SOLSE|nr:A-kinase anchor protein 12b isoform X2 [Solea senegalensis]KAG7509210.1 A-kinase anchor protein 12 isoform X2 [Solea senegalensis]